MDWNKVATANKNFYDQIASVYDQIDSRRGENKHEWIDQVFTHALGLLDKKSGSPTFLDAGSGSGFLAMKAKEYFKDLVLVDISPAMLEQIPITGQRKIVADCANIPLPDASVDMIGAFATLHHLYSPRDFFKEAARLLKKGGLLYTDHDIECHFVDNFKLPLSLYRHFFDHGIDYLKVCPQAQAEDYHLSEFHGDNGLNAALLKKELEELGFSCLELTYHWQGMGLPGKVIEFSTLDSLFNRPGMAPVFRLIARKG